ncbi:MAG: helix-turn-helix domain-containing protein [Nocardioidaceae bacterium]
MGPRIRALREARGWTVTAFAQTVGVSSGMISQVERGLTDPSLETLRRIAQALEVPIFSLFQDDGGGDEAVRVVRGDRRMFVRSPHGDITYSRISAGPGRLEVLEGMLEAGGTSSEELWSHPSEECAVVLAGRLTLQVGDDEWVLAEQDSCSFDSRLPHRYLNPTKKPCRFLLAVTPPSY